MRKESETTLRFEALNKFIDQSRPLHDTQSLLMGTLHYTQELFGYIPRQAIEFISESLKVPTAHIYGMVTFYNYFSLKPRPQYQIHVCKGTACYVSGGARVLERLKQELKIEIGEVSDDGLFGLSVTRCLGCCGLAPVMQINEDVYVRVVPEKVPTIIATYRKKKLSKKMPVAVGEFEHPGKSE
ncbi:MAG: NAD(P)H-dependent oxidoreductase subunit E [Candidatus Omnitrophica bacterium]|nr:NAD(P)H-dependent oxidoreductase subunit E [Candidatus Omnitrophota bacterium]